VADFFTPPSSRIKPACRQSSETSILSSTCSSGDKGLGSSGGSAGIGGSDGILDDGCIDETSEWSSGVRRGGMDGMDGMDGMAGIDGMDDAKGSTTGGVLVTESACVATHRVLGVASTWSD
jgi:hypothetical protein